MAADEAADFEITPEMIEAGAEVILLDNLGGDPLTARNLAQSVLLAAFAVRT